MQVRTVVETTQEVLVEVSLDEVMAEIAALETPERTQEALRLLSLCVGAIKKVPDSVVAEMSAVQKKILADAMAFEVNRFSKGVDPVEGMTWPG